MRLRRILVAIAAGKALAFAAFAVTAFGSAPSGSVTPGPAVAPPIVEIACTVDPIMGRCAP